MLAVEPSSVKPKRRKLTLQDAEAIANLVAESKLTETEACSRLDINRDQWFNFKSRGKRLEEFDRLITRIRGASIAHAMSKIKDAGDGVGMKQPDWRAHAFRLQTIAPERFGQQQGQGQQPVVAIISDAQLKAIADRIYGQPSQAQVVDVQEIKQVQDKPD